jgi:hypothetical protein
MGWHIDVLVAMTSGYTSHARQTSSAVGVARQRRFTPPRTDRGCLLVSSVNEGPVRKLIGLLLLLSATSCGENPRSRSSPPATTQSSAPSDVSADPLIDQSWVAKLPRPSAREEIKYCRLHHWDGRSAGVVLVLFVVRDRDLACLYGRAYEVSNVDTSLLGDGDDSRFALSHTAVPSAVSGRVREITIGEDGDPLVSVEFHGNVYRFTIKLAQLQSGEPVPVTRDK